MGLFGGSRVYEINSNKQIGFIWVYWVYLGQFGFNWVCWVYGGQGHFHLVYGVEVAGGGGCGASSTVCKPC